MEFKRIKPTANLVIQIPNGQTVAVPADEIDEFRIDIIPNNELDPYGCRYDDMEALRHADSFEIVLRAKATRIIHMPHGGLKKWLKYQHRLRNEHEK